MPIRILIADDHTVVREGLRAILEAQTDIIIVGEARDGRDALTKAELLKPDLIFMDISMPDISGIEATRMVLKLLPTVRIIMLSMHHTNEYVSRAMQAGARAYLLKESAGFSAVNAVRAVMRGRQYFDEGVEAPSDKQSGKTVRATTPLSSLSKRERETLQLVVEGNTNATIAERLHVSPKTVETYRSRMMQKLNISNVPALVMFALRHGVISPP